ncbi:hypothetical protein C8R44DRAFT_809024 [Mycena epipterygia]|nr:hypothetical protein C8R44DRAFT_809024 [Mycena epipterygia]
MGGRLCLAHMTRLHCKGTPTMFNLLPSPLMEHTLYPAQLTRLFESGMQSHISKLMLLFFPLILSMTNLPQYDGWLVGPKGQLILWIPEHLVSSMPQCRLLGICGPHPILKFDPSTVYHGTEWTKYYTPANRQSV